MKKLKISLFYPLVIALFAIASIGLTYYRHSNINLVSIVDETQNYYLQTYADDVKSVLEMCHIELEPHDLISHTLDTKIDGDMTIEISRSFELTVRDGDETQVIETTKHTVREILNEQDILLEELDIVAPFIDAKISTGTHISITRVWDEYVSESYQIPYLTEINLIPSLDDTEVEMVQEGLNGEKQINYRLRYENGELVSRNFIDEVVISEPINEIKNKGTDNLLVTSRGMPFRYSKVIIMQATAYDLSYESCAKYPGDPGYGITYSGTYARPGVVAVDPRVIPLHSNLYIESLDYTQDYGFALAEDTGSAIKGNKIDLFIGDHSAALRYGRRNVKVYVIEDQVDEEFIRGYGY